MFNCNCCFLTCILVSQKAGRVVCYSHLMKNFPHFVVIHTVKGFNVVNEVDALLVPLLFLWSNRCWYFDLWLKFVQAFSKSSSYIWNFLIHLLLKPSWKTFEQYLANMWSEWNCTVIWTFFGIALLWDWNENWLSSPVVTAKFSKFAGILSAALSQHHLLGFEIAQLEFHHLH